MQRLCGLSLDIYEDVVDGFARVAHAQGDLDLVVATGLTHVAALGQALTAIHLLAQRGVEATQVWLLDRVVVDGGGSRAAFCSSALRDSSVLPPGSRKPV